MCMKMRENEGKMLSQSELSITSTMGDNATTPYLEARVGDTYNKMEDDPDHENVKESSGVEDKTIKETNKTGKVKKNKPGIVYIPNFPPYMTIMKAKEMLGQFGEIKRTYFQPKEMKGKNKNKPSIHFSEGWIEFKSKRVAKEVAARMNNTIVGGKKTSKYYDHLWNIKYLSGFKWVHLNERLAYERAVRKQKMRIEIAQAKKEAEIFAANVGKSKKLKKLKIDQPICNEYIQRQTESEIIASRNESEKPEDRTEFLKSLFASS